MGSGTGRMTVPLGDESFWSCPRDQLHDPRILKGSYFLLFRYESHGELPKVKRIRANAKFAIPAIPIWQQGNARKPSESLPDRRVRPVFPGYQGKCELVRWKMEILGILLLGSPWLGSQVFGSPSRSFWDLSTSVFLADATPVVSCGSLDCVRLTPPVSLMQSRDEPAWKIIWGI